MFYTYNDFIFATISLAICFSPILTHISFCYFGSPLEKRSLVIIKRSGYTKYRHKGKRRYLIINTNTYSIITLDVFCLN